MSETEETLILRFWRIVDLCKTVPACRIAQPLAHPLRGPLAFQSLQGPFHLHMLVIVLSGFLLILFLNMLQMIVSDFLFA